MSSNQAEQESPDLVVLKELQEEGGHSGRDADEEVDHDEEHVRCAGDLKPEGCRIHNGSDGPPEGTERSWTKGTRVLEEGRPNPGSCEATWELEAGGDGAGVSPIEEEEGEDGGEVGGGGVGRQVEDKEDEDAAGGRNQVVQLGREGW